MAVFTVEVKDQEVLARLRDLVAKVGNPRPFLQAVGEDIMERTKGRFATSSGPDGARWAPNAPSTIAAYIAKRGGAGKRGTAKKGVGLATGKRPLIGFSKDLARQFDVRADGNSVTVGSTMRYAAMQQFGGKRSQFPHLWGDIPARPFLPVTVSGDLYPAERDAIVATLNRYLTGA